MASVSINDIPVISGSIYMPLNGTWTADIYAATDNTINDKVSITSGNLTLNGTVVNSGVVEGGLYMRVIGGNNSLHLPTKPQYYSGATVKNILMRIMSSVGEQVSQSIAPDVANKVLTSYTLFASTASDAVRILCDRYNWSRRILPDGTFWVGNESWERASEDYYYVVVESTPNSNRYFLDVLSLELLPGMSIEEGNISYVEHHISPNGLQSIITIDDDQSDAILAIAKAAIPRIDYYALYRAKVITVNGNKVDLIPDSPHIPGMGNVEYLSPAGYTPSILPGSSVLLGWQEADPAKPYAILATNETVSNVDIKIAGATMIKASTTGITLGSNPITTPVLTVGAVDSMGVPITNAPTNTGTVKAG